MELDAFTGGVTPDGLKNKNDIRILICYLLKGVKEPISREAIVNMCFEHGFANYFETIEALTDLIECGSIIKNENDEVIIGEGGIIAADTLYSKLPITVRERAMSAALKLIARKKIERENEVTIQKRDNGYYVECRTKDGDGSMMCIGLATSDEEQARTIRDRFLDNPSRIYTGLINMMLLDSGEKM